jgi:hypothetical protein
MTMNGKSRNQSNLSPDSDYPRDKNAARASPLAGRFIPSKYLSPIDTQHLMTTDKFHDQFIRNKPGNKYTGRRDVIEVPSPTSTQSPITATFSASQRSDSQTSMGSNDHRYNEYSAPSGWYLALIILEN